MELTNYWIEHKKAQHNKFIPSSFVHLEEKRPCDNIDETWRRIIPVVTELRNSKTTDFYKQSSVDLATLAASIFVSMVPDEILQHKRLIDFDIQVDDSVEIVFKGRQQVRVNLMLESLKTQEEAFLFYQRDGLPTQTNGYMSEIVEILKQIL